MIDWEAQRAYAARSRAIHFLRRWEQGQLPSSLSLGVCGNLDAVMRYDRVTGVKFRQWESLPISMMLAYPYPRNTTYKAGLTRVMDMYDLIDTLCVDWGESYGAPTYPIDGLTGYNRDREFSTMWEGLNGAKRRRLCGWIADLLEREEV